MQEQNPSTINPEAGDCHEREGGQLASQSLWIVCTPITPDAGLCRTTSWFSLASFLV